jgi:transcriptional regulator with XRE-family HTH domain
MLLSQERVAEMSGLSLRTVQRLEAGHRVSYASLRALAVAVKTDADVLEWEFYAVNHIDSGRAPKMRPQKLPAPGEA